MTRAEHLAWAKQRALELVDRGELQEACASMVSDLGKHEDFQKSAKVYGGLLVAALMFEVRKGPEAVRRWIEGFN